MAVEPLEAKIRQIDLHCKGELSVAAKELRSGDTVSVSGEQVYATASTIKLPILVELWRQAEEGVVDLADRYPLTAEAQEGGGGILKALEPGIEPTLRDLGVLMTVVSDNTATNMVIDAIGGADRANKLMRDKGLSTICLHGDIDYDRIAEDNRNLGEASCLDMMRLMEMLVQGELLGQSASAEVLEILKGQQVLDQLPRYLQHDPYAKERGVGQVLSIANKAGLLLGMRSDVGAVWLGDGRCVTYAITCQNSPDLSLGPENEAMVVVGLIGRAIVEQWWPMASAPVLETAYTERYGLPDDRRADFRRIWDPARSPGR